MCGRYTIAKPERVIAVFMPRIITADISRPRYNIAPMQDVPVIIGNAEARALRNCQWGFVPGWASDPAIGNRMINARSETVAVKPAFRAAFRNGRCLVPADGYYEWRKTRTGKQPVYIHPSDNEPMAFAGLYSSWSGNASSANLLSCTILTREADGWLAPVHDRMPVILPEELWDSWADSARPGEAILREILDVPTGRGLVLTEVSTLVNSPAHDSKECVVPLADQLFPNGNS